MKDHNEGSLDAPVGIRSITEPSYVENYAYNQVIAPWKYGKRAMEARSKYYWDLCALVIVMRADAVRRAHEARR